MFIVQSGTESRFIKPGSPLQSGHADSFVSRLRAELLDVEVFHNLAESQVKPAVFRRYYNEKRPHSSLGSRPLALAAAQFTDFGRATPSLHPHTAVSSMEDSF